MHIKQFPFVPTLSLVIMMVAACGSDGGGGGDGSFIPNIPAATWTNRADPSGTNTFFFVVDSPTKNKSRFTGNENAAGSADQHPFSGSYTNRNIEFTYSPASSKSGKSYTGTINDASTEITLTSPSLGNLVLEKR